MPGLLGLLGLLGSWEVLVLVPVPIGVRTGWLLETCFEDLSALRAQIRGPRAGQGAPIAPEIAAIQTLEFPEFRKISLDFLRILLGFYQENRISLDFLGGPRRS